MDVKVDHNDSLNFSVAQKNLGCDGNVIENAKSAAEIWMCVVSSTRQVAGDTLLQCKSCGQQCSSDSEPGALHKWACGWQTDPSLFWPAESVAAKGFMVSTGMNRLKISTRNTQGFVDLLWLDDLLIQ